jgi:hypothetical protein
MNKEFDNDYAASGQELSAEEWLADLKAGDDAIGALAAALAHAYEELGQPAMTADIWRRLATIAIGH